MPIQKGKVGRPRKVVPPAPIALNAVVSNAAGDVTGNAADATPVRAIEQPPTDGLIEMHKAGEHIHVHPTCVAAHKTIGWSLA